jgi:hypothetical protein
VGTTAGPIPQAHKPNIIMTKVSELKGKRILYRTQSSEQLREGVVEELTEGGNARIGTEWHPADHVRVVEELPKAKAPKAEKEAKQPQVPKAPAGSSASENTSTSATPPQ